jgi:hypothetical protein
VESFNGRLRDECLNEHLFPALALASRIIETWRTDYNTVRRTSVSAGWRPPSLRTVPAIGIWTSKLSHKRPKKNGERVTMGLLPAMSVKPVLYIASFDCLTFSIAMKAIGTSVG